jgi:HPt (histidine-containing phosphotransfer) domain-containing protein
MPIQNIDYSNINYDEMAAAIGLKVKHMPMLVGSFIEESLATMDNLSAAIDSADYPVIKANAHSIKGSAGNLKFNEIYEMAKEMEHSANESDVDFDYTGYSEAIKAAILTIPS